jgi:hypothetical protein
MLTIEEIILLIEKLEKIKGTDLEKLIETNIKDLKTLKETIERKDKEVGNFESKGPAWFRQDLISKKDTARSNLLYRDIKDKIWHFAKTNMYNSLEIGPGHTEFSDLFLSWRNQFFLDILPEIEKKVRDKFNPQHQKYIKFFVTDGHHCANVPRNSVNFVFSWDTFVHFSSDQIEQYLQSLQEIIIPGGYVMIQYADCHYDYDLEQSKKGYWAYNNKAIMSSIIEKTNYIIIELGQFKPGHNYAIFKKPGKQNPVLYKISELELD